MALTLGILIPAIVVLVSVILFVRGYFEIRREAEESEKEKEKKNKRKHGSLESEWIVLFLSIMKTLLNYKKN